MKLELEHLKPYPNNLVLIEKTGTYMTFEGIDYESNQVIAERIGWNLEDIKPVLRQMSSVIDLIKEEFEKYHSGKDYDEDVIDFFCDELIGDIDELDNMIIDYLPYGAVKWLTENFYDIFSLIDNNLAIDINTLKT